MKHKFDISRLARADGKYTPWVVKNSPVLLSELNLNKKETILVIDHVKNPYGFLLSEIIPRHSAQGKVDEEDFLITFCGACNAGVHMSPVIDGKVHHFKVIGAYNGQAVFEDEETKSIWNHITGECMYGPLEGKKLEVTGLKMTTVGEELKINPKLNMFISGQSIKDKIMVFMIRVMLGKSKEWLPARFFKTMTEVDDRLPIMTLGLAVQIGNIIKFYDRNQIADGMKDTIDGKTITLFSDAVPYAVDEEGNRPFQLFMRWYGFNLTYPEGVLYTP